jgi:hypothetical protein
LTSVQAPSRRLANPFSVGITYAVRTDVKKAPKLAVAMSEVKTFLKIADNFSKAVQDFNKKVMEAGGTLKFNIFTRSNIFKSSNNYFNEVQYFDAVQSLLFRVRQEV